MYLSKLSATTRELPKTRARIMAEEIASAHISNKDDLIDIIEQTINNHMERTGGEGMSYQKLSQKEWDKRLVVANTYFSECPKCGSPVPHESQCWYCGDSSNVIMVGEE